MAQIKGECSVTVARTVNTSTASNISASKFLNPTVNNSTQFYLYRYSDLGNRLTSLPTYKFYYIDQGTKTQITDLSLVYDGNGLFHISGNLNSYTFYYKPSTGESKSYDEWMNVVIALMDENNNLFALSTALPITFAKGGDTMATVSIPSNTITVSNTSSPVTMTKTTDLVLPYDISTNAHKFDSTFYSSYVKTDSGVSNNYGAIYSSIGYTTSSTYMGIDYTFLADDSAYEKVDYIESTGSQYINTGFSVPTASSSDTFKVVSKIVCTNTASGTRKFMFGFNNPSYSHYAEINAEGYYGTYEAYGSTVLTNDTTYYAQMIITGGTQTEYGISTNANAIVTTSTSTTYQSTTWGTFNLFCINTSYMCSNVRMYDCQMYYNGTLVRDFIPARRKADNVYGMYDQLNGVFYENAGTGAFTGA